MESQERPVICIEGEKVALGPIRREHVPLYERWLNDVAVAIPYFNGELVPDPREALEERYERLRKEVSFTVYERQGLRPIGLTDLYRVSQFNGTAEFGIVIGEKDGWGKGYGTEATRLVLDWGFHAMGLNNIQLKVFSYNERAIRAYLRAGFREIGRRRQAKRVGQHLYDVVYMDCIAAEFEGSVLRAHMPG